MVPSNYFFFLYFFQLHKSTAVAQISTEQFYNNKKWECTDTHVIDGHTGTYITSINSFVHPSTSHLENTHAPSCVYVCTLYVCM